MSQSPDSDPRSQPFDIVDPADRGPARLDALLARELPPGIGDHREAARHYQPDPELIDAINVALAVGAPLLLTGEPGTGKTQVAHYLAWFFDIEDHLYPLYVRSTTTAEDLLYTYDAVAYLHASQDPKRKGEDISRGEFVEPGPLWRAYTCPQAAVVLIDEIDKAPRDFPNDILNVIDQHAFTVKPTGLVVNRGAKAPPVVVITSNSERRLPEPFLRRCIVHDIQLTEDLVRRAVAARVGDFPHLDDELREAAIGRFVELRGLKLRKPPATAELLVWLAVLSARRRSRPLSRDDIAKCPLRELPALGALVKDRADRDLL